MKGAIIGDIVGSVYEWNNTKDENFEPLFREDGFFTDDSVLTLAVAAAILKTDRSGPGVPDESFYLPTDETKDKRDRLLETLTHAYRLFTEEFPGRGYGGHFAQWAHTPDAPAYESCGNGSAMRASPVAWYAKTLEECEELAELTALPTHNHPDGIAGAKATAGATFLALHGGSKEAIKAYVEQYYPLPKTYEEVQPDYVWHSLCDGTVQPAVLAFLASNDFEDAIRKAIALGGDSDTIAAITGPIAEAYYGVPEDLWATAAEYLDEDLLGIVDRFYDLCEARNK